MRCGVILAQEMGRELRPLTDRRTPTSFLALGHARTLLQRSVDRWQGVISPSNIWVLVGKGCRSRAVSSLDRQVHVLTAPEERYRALLRGVEEIRAAGGSMVVVQDATHTFRDETLYRLRLREGVSLASTRRRGVSYIAPGKAGDERVTGIEAWPLDVLQRRLGDVHEMGDASARNQKMLRHSLGNVGWVDAADWDGIRDLLAYVEKPWGHEEVWALTSDYAGKVLFIRAGESLSLQYHRVKDETIRIAAGRMRFRAGPSARQLKTFILEPGASFPIPPGLVHQMEALEDCTVVEVSTPHLTDVVRLVDRYGRT